MATVLLSAGGAAVGSSIGGTFAGLSSAVIGRAVGATFGRVLDQKLMGSGSDAVETGRVDRFRLTNAGEGDPIAQVYGRMRLGGHIIWASDFGEATTVTGGGKGAPSQPKTTEYSYTVSLAVAVCEGEISGVGRVWADGEEVSPDSLNMRVYPGSQDQLPDPAIEAVEGAGSVPAYRGTAYVVLEDLALQRFGNRVPQFSFEVLRPEQSNENGAEYEMTRGIEAVAMIPGTGEYALATTPVYFSDGAGTQSGANVNSPSGKADFAQSLETLSAELPACRAASLVVSWFGDDLRAGHCNLKPKVEHKLADGQKMPWSVSGLTRSTAEEVSLLDGRPVYGGTPTDQSVVEAIEAMNAAGTAVMFYPFILMEQLDGNVLPDPYSDAVSQPALPWRGRITTDKAPGLFGTTDKTIAARAEVDAFFGTVRPDDFAISGKQVTYSGPQEWTMSRFILHYAALCVAAGGVDAFCIGSELRGLTQIRAEAHSFPAVERLRALAADVRAILGPDTKISYAADWSEYFGYQPVDAAGDRYFHLDPLWMDENVDFIGIDNYMPLSDWRDGVDHADADWGAIYDLEYLKSNIEGGEGFDWYYHSIDAQNAQIRTAITDEAEGEPWVWRYKDIRSFWSLVHYDRVDGMRASEPNSWEPGAKPIWFTEMGCAAIDKGTNEPNKFLDAKSSESDLPKYSTGARDDLIQKQYLRAMTEYWQDPVNNPESEFYEGRMIDTSRLFVWAWDTRPFPFFPNNTGLWSDGENYSRGHWINGRTASRSLASVVSEICENAGVAAYDTHDLHGYVRGYLVGDVSDARSVLQPLMLRYGFDAVERDGGLSFKMRSGLNATDLDLDRLALSADLESSLEQTREAEAEMTGRVRLKFVQSDGNFDNVAEEAVLSDEATHAVSSSEFPMSMTRLEGRQVSERWLTEARLARDTVRLALPASMAALGAGDIIRLPGDQTEGEALFRIDRVEHGASQLMEAVRVEPSVYEPSSIEEQMPRVEEFVAPVPVTPFFLDLPMLSGDEVPHAPHVAVTGKIWPGEIAIYQSSDEENFSLNSVLGQRSIIGVTQSDLNTAPSGILDHSSDLTVKLTTGTLSSITQNALLVGGNLAAIGDGSTGHWEIIQFRDANLVAQDTYTLTNLLRGQAGSDAIVSAPWPTGSWFVLLNGAVSQIEYASNLRGIDQNFLIGPANTTYDHPSFLKRQHAFEGNGLRPLSPVHLKVEDKTSTHEVSWIRRSRIEGDDWGAGDIPIGEESESYILRVKSGSSVLREELLTQTQWSYPEAIRASDGVFGIYTIEVAQVSARYGVGLFRQVQVAA